MPRLPRLAAALMVLAGPTSASAPAKQPRITSVYTKLDSDRCKSSEDSLTKCQGYAGVPLFLVEGHLWFDISAGDEAGASNPVNASPGGPDDGMVEWRLADGKPFAIIYRLTFDNGDGSQFTRLIVKTIATPQKPTCQIAEIEGATPKANAIARSTADAWLSGKSVCADPSSYGAYTRLTKNDWDRCEIIEREGNSEVRRCQGAVSAYAYDIPLFVQRYSGAYDLDAGALDQDPLLPGRVVKPPKDIEWPQKHGPPFAMIYRLEAVEKPGQKRWSHIMVESIGTPGKPGCRIAEIDGTRPNANIEARAAAEAIMKGTAKCLYAR